MMIASGFRNQGGVALLQVLLLSMLISLLLMQLVYTARGQLELANEIEQRVQADLLLYSAKSEAVFSRLISPPSPRQEDFSLISASTPALYQATDFVQGYEVETTLRDVAGLLPLRSPGHPLWPGTLEALGMSQTAAMSLLTELSEMQDRDAVDQRFGDEPSLSSSDFKYPNAPLQTKNGLATWVALEPFMRAKIETISHHYTRSIVNLSASPDLIVGVALGEYGKTVVDRSGGIRSDKWLIEYLEDRYGLSVNTERSNLWRLDVIVRSDELTRSARYDFYVNPRDAVPFSLVSQ